MAFLPSLAKPFTPLLLSLWMVAGLRSPAQAQAVPSAREIAREQEVVRLSLNRDELLERNRAYVLPALGVGLGVVTLVVGGVVFPRAWADGYNVRMERMGLVMMPLGAALILIDTPMFAIRLSRTRRLKRTTRRLERLGERVALGPSWTGKGVYARLRF